MSLLQTLTSTPVYPILAGCSAVALVVSFFILYKLTNIKSISIPLNITLIISLFLPLSTTYLLPIDLATPTSSNTIGLLWKINYWITYVSTWLILPFWQYYLSSGQFTIINRLKASAFSLLKYLIILIIIGVIFLIYVVIYHRDSLNLKFLNSLLITTSHIYSLTMAIWLMSNGLIHLPKKYWLTSYSIKLNNDYIKLPELQMHLEDSKFELRDIVNKINSLNEIQNLNSSNLDISIRDNILYLYNKIPQDFQNERSIRSNNNYQFLVDNIGVPVNEINSNYLSKLNEDLKWKIWDYQHTKSTFDGKIMDIVYLEDIINYLNYSSSFADVDDDNNLEVEWRSFKIKWPRWMFHYFWPLVNKLFALMFVIISLVIIESEMLHGTKLSIMSWIIQKADTLGCFEMVFFLIIMMSCSLVSLSMIKLFNIYKVEFNSNSDPVSSIFFISYSLRLTIPLNYNFLMLLNKDATANSAFLKFVSGNLQLIKIGEILNDIIPRLILIPVLMSFFGIWGKLRRWLDGYFLFDYILDEMDFDDDAVDQTTDRMNPSNVDDIESVVGTTNKNSALLHEGRSISQRYISNGLIPLNDSLTITTINNTRSTSNSFVTLPIKLIKSLSNIKLGNIFNFRRGSNSPLNIDDYNYDDGLRSYNLGTGIVLESRRNSNTSEQSGVSGVSGLSGEYDADNRVLGDEYIKTIH